MRKGVYQYPFHGERMTLPEISRYYNNKEIELNCTMFALEVKKIVNDVGAENITEEQILNAVKNVLYKKSLCAALPHFKESCIEEFGQEFWDGLIEKKAINRAKMLNKKSAKSFREGIKVSSNQNQETMTENRVKMKSEREGKDGGSR